MPDEIHTLLFPANIFPEQLAFSNFPIVSV